MVSSLVSEAPAIGAFHGPASPKHQQVKGPAWAGRRNEDQEIRRSFTRGDERKPASTVLWPSVLDVTKACSNNVEARARPAAR